MILPSKPPFGRRRNDENATSAPPAHPRDALRQSERPRQMCESPVATQLALALMTGLGDASGEMLFRQLQDRSSRAFTYLVASRRGGEALFIDPVRRHLALYLRLIEALDLRLVFAIDTHVHTAHESALEGLLDHTHCVTAMGQESRAECVARHLSDGEVLHLDGLELQAMFTPGHTPDSYSYVMADRVFTGDTLLIRGTGRTDQGGDARAQYASLGRLLALPGHTLVYPAHDYNGRHVSSIADERRLNPRLQARSADEYVALMAGVRPSDARLTDDAGAPSLRPSAPLMQELIRLKRSLSGGAAAPHHLRARRADVPGAG